MDFTNYIIEAFSILVFIALINGLKRFFDHKSEVNDEYKKAKKMVEDFEKEYPIND